MQKKDNQYNTKLSRDILSPTFLWFAIVMSSNVMADDDLFDGIRPTGYWYTSALIDFRNIDGCFSPISVNATRYDAIFTSFNSAKTELFNKQYKGGECEESNDVENEKPDDWPLSSHQWQAFQKQFPSSLKPMTIHYHCTSPSSRNEDYFFNFKLQPQYKCDDVTCSNYRKACAGDVYAGDLMQSPFEPLGHTGLVYSADEVDPKKSHLIMEVLNTEPIIHTDTPLSDVKNTRPVWGVRYGYGKLNDNGEMRYFDALRMLSLGFIQSQFCPIYTKEPIYKEGSYSFISIHDPFNHQTKKLLTNNCAVFRCDTFVQYLYKTVLDVRLPPNNVLQMPKDLFNAFPNQRGDAVTNAVALNVENKQSKARQNKSSQALFEFYQDKDQSTYSRSASLDAINEPNQIKFKTLLKETRTEDVDELKSQLFYLMLEKAKKENISKEDWRSLKSMSLSALHDSFDPRIIVNALLISEIVLTPDDMITEIQCLLDRLSTNFTDNALIMINKAINSSLFHLMINSDSMIIHHQIDTMIGGLARDSVTESFSVFINMIPKEQLSFSKTALHRYLADTTTGYFHPNDFPRSYFRVSSWSTAFLTTKSPDITSEQDLYAFLKKMDDEFVLSLLIVENKKHFKTPEIKLNLLSLLNKKKRLNHSVNHPMKAAIVAEARLIVNNGGAL